MQSFRPTAHTVKLVFFVCPLFCEYRDLGGAAKITGRECSKSHAVFVYYLVQQAKTPKLRTQKQCNLPKLRFLQYFPLGRKSTL